MRLTYALLSTTFLAPALAHPWMRPTDPSLEKKSGSGGCPFGFDKLEQLKRDGKLDEAELEKRILGLGEGGGLLGLGLEETVGNVLTGAGGLLEGLLGRVAKLGEGEKKIPDAAHPFQAPGPTDQRGPCPGLNTLANHGYISRSGIVTSGEVIEGVGEGFNMSPELAALLVFIATAFGGNVESQVFSIGGEDDRTYSQAGIGARAAGRQLGLDGHSRCEGDISAMRRDYFLNNGDNHNAYPDRFKRFIELAKQNGGEFGVDAANQLYGQNAQESINSNDKLFFNSYTIIVVLGEYPFIPNFMSNGTYGAGGVANYESISSIYGMQTNEDGTICYVPERFPENWYRRAVPYGVVDLVAGLAPTYLTGPELTLPNPLGILQNPGQTGEIGCALYQGLTSGIPAALLGQANDQISSALTFLTNNLRLPTVYGCNPSQPSLATNTSGGAQYDMYEASGGQSYGNICA